MSGPGWGGGTYKVQQDHHQRVDSCTRISARFGGDGGRGAGFTDAQDDVPEPPMGRQTAACELRRAAPQLPAAGHGLAVAVEHRDVLEAADRYQAGDIG